MAALATGSHTWVPTVRRTMRNEGPVHVAAAVDLLWRHAVPSLPPPILWMLGGGQGLLTRPGFFVSPDSDFLICFKVAYLLGLGLGDWVSVKVRFGWRIREVPCLQIQGEIYTHSELLRTSGVRRGVGVNKSVNRGLPGSQGELGSQRGRSLDVSRRLWGRFWSLMTVIGVSGHWNDATGSVCEERCESGP